MNYMTKAFVERSEALATGIKIRLSILAQIKELWT